MDIGENSKPKSKIIDLDTAKQPDTKIPFDFENDDFVDHEIEQPTVDADKNDRNTGTKPTLDEARKNLVDMEASSKTQFSFSDLEDFADVAMDLVDTFIGIVLRFWSGDPDAVNTGVPKSKQDKLKKQITYLLVKYQTKFSLEFMFLLSVILIYSVPYMKAKDFRKARLARERNLAGNAERYQEKKEDLKEKREEKKKEKQEAKQQEEVHVAEVIPETETETEQEKPKRTVRLGFKKKPGGQKRY
jgi:hypothetical protein